MCFRWLVKSNMVWFCSRSQQEGLRPRSHQTEHQTEPRWAPSPTQPCKRRPLEVLQALQPELECWDPEYKDYVTQKVTKVQLISLFGERNSTEGPWGQLSQYWKHQYFCSSCHFWLNWGWADQRRLCVHQSGAIRGRPPPLRVLLLLTGLAILFCPDVNNNSYITAIFLPYYILLHAVKSTGRLNHE